ncbi:MAG: SdrD B-like domain-containing protein [bacterium]
MKKGFFPVSFFVFVILCVGCYPTSTRQRAAAKITTKISCTDNTEYTPTRRDQVPIPWVFWLVDDANPDMYMPCVRLSASSGESLSMRWYYAFCLPPDPPAIPRIPSLDELLWDTNTDQPASIPDTTDWVCGNPNVPQLISPGGDGIMLDAPIETIKKYDAILVALEVMNEDFEVIGHSVNEAIISSEGTTIEEVAVNFDIKNTSGFPMTGFELDFSGVGFSCDDYTEYYILNVLGFIVGEEGNWGYDPVEEEKALVIRYVDSSPDTLLKTEMIWIDQERPLENNEWVHLGIHVNPQYLSWFADAAENFIVDDTTTEVTGYMTGVDLYQPAAIGDFVWEDTDADGIQDTGEPGISGVTVNLYDYSTDALRATTTTDPNGSYRFDNLTPGDYYVEFVAPGGLIFSPQDRGTDDAVDSDADTTTGMTVSTTLTSGETDLNWDAGLACALKVEKYCCIPPPPPGSGGNDCQGKVTKMVLEYIGGECSQTSNFQEGKASCNGADPGEPVDIAFGGKEAAKYSATPSAGIDKGTSFAVTFADGDKIEFKADTLFNVTGPNGTQSLKIHTSCSKDLNAGDIIGSVKLIELTTTEGGTVALFDPAETSACYPAGDPPGTVCDSRLTELVVQYNGAACQSPLPNPQGGKAVCSGVAAGHTDVSIIYTGKDPDTITVSPSSGINDADIVRITATGRPELEADTTLEIRSGTTLLQSLKIHTSCSQPLALGDEFGSLRVVEFTTRDGGTSMLPDPGPPPPPSSECMIDAPPPPPHCTDKIEALGLRYLGGSCSDTSNYQGGKVQCTDTPIGPPYGTEPVQIEVWGTGKDAGKQFLYAGNVHIGDVVRAVASVGGKKELGADSVIQIKGRDIDNNVVLLEEILFHTSCSQPLNLGDRLGAMEVFSIDPKGGFEVSLGGVVEYQYTITNLSGVTVDHVTVEDSLLGEIESDLSIPGGQSVTFYRQALVTRDTENIVTVTPDSAQECLPTAYATVTVEPVPEVPDSCDTLGKPRELIFEYTGESCDPNFDNLQNGRFLCSGDTGGAHPVRIVITKDMEKVTVSPSTEVIEPGTPGTLVTFTATGTRLPAEIAFDIVKDGAELQSLTIHTSCSQPLTVGDRFGNMVLKAFIPE